MESNQKQKIDDQANDSAQDEKALKNDEANQPEKKKKKKKKKKNKMDYGKIKE